MQLPFTHDIARVHRNRIGETGLSDQALAAASDAVADALARLKREDEARSLALLSMPAETGDLAGTRAAAARLTAGATDIVFLGTGGSSLGAQTLGQIAGHAVPGLGRLMSGPRVHFLDNLDPLTFETVLAALPLPTTRFAAISKSGGTGETLMQTMAVIAVLEDAKLPVSDHVIGLSEPQKEGAKRNALRGLLEPYGVSFLDHHTGIGGRFSVLTNVGLLPAAVFGLNIEAIRAGAGDMLANLRAAERIEDCPAALGAAVNIAAARSGKPVAVMMGYADKFERFAKWWVQLWAESLGKNGEGTQPVAALGPVDQHSQVQLYLGGPKDKLFTVLTTGVAGRGPRIRADLAQAGAEPDFGGRTIGDLVAAQGRATADTLARNGCATRLMHVPELNERSLGALLMHFMLETILAGYALGIDPYDQPAVEEGKVLAKQYLSESAA